MSGYTQQYLAIKQFYDRLPLFDDETINRNIAALDVALQAYEKIDPSNKAALESKADALEAAFLPISQYYADLTNIKGQLQNYIDSSSSKVIDLENHLITEERYNNRVHPEESVKPREIMFGLLPELRPSTVPVLMTAGVFLASISILMIFQMVGLTGQLNLPPALISLLGKLNEASGTAPLYQNPMILGGLSIVFGAAMIVFAVLYFKEKY